MPQVTWRPGNDYVIVGREDVLAAPFGQIAAELSRAHSRKAIGLDGKQP